MKKLIVLSALVISAFTIARFLKKEIEEYDWEEAGRVILPKE